MIYRNKNGTFSNNTKSGKPFTKGNIPWNQGLKGYRASPETEFKEGQHVGPEHPSWKGGVQITKSDGVFLWTGRNSRTRRPRKIYSDTYGEIPSGYVIFHKDGDKYNDDPSNLEAISRKELIQRNNASSRKRSKKKT